MKIIKTKDAAEYRAKYLDYKLEEQDAHLEYLLDPSLEKEHDWRLAQTTLMMFLEDMVDAVLF